MKKYIVTITLIATQILFAANNDRQLYVEKYKDIAIKEMKRSGIPASITLAQGILESGCGKSSLALKSNNHFGIKCHGNWNGKTTKHDDDRPNECFRVYDHPERSYHDHSQFLLKNTRYKFLFDLKPTDYKGWAHGLKKAGYATANDYAHLLIKIIEEEKLYRFDERSYKPEQDVYEPEIYASVNIDDYKITPFGGEVVKENRIEYTVARKGDTYEKIAEEQGVMLWQILKYNERTKGYPVIPGEPIYLQPKRRKADVKYKTHTIEKGETMYSISQKYGIKIKYLYMKNNIEFGSEPEVGTVLNLRKKKKPDA